MAAAEVAKAVVWEDSGAAMMARIVGNDAAAITQATVTSITRHTYDLDAASPTTDIEDPGTSLTVSTVVFDTLQTDSRWTEDSTGYNFRDDVDDTLFSTGGNRYRVEYVVEPSSGAKFHVVYEVTARPVVVT